MLPAQIKELRQQYTDQYVAVVGDQPELARFHGLVGQVKTVNMGGRALVQFEANGDRAWYDLSISGLKVVEKPAAPVVEKKAAPAVKAKAPEGKPAEKPAAGE